MARSLAVYTIYKLLYGNKYLFYETVCSSGSLCVCARALCMCAYVRDFACLCAHRIVRLTSTRSPVHRHTDTVYCTQKKVYEPNAVDYERNTSAI